MRKSSVGPALGIMCLALAIAAMLVIRPATAVEGFLDNPSTSNAYDAQIQAHTRALIDEGREVFRYDTFGSETFWGNTLRLHDAIQGSTFGGVGNGVSATTALTVGLKVDSDAIPQPVAAAILAGEVDLDDPATTLALLQLGAVVGVTGIFNDQTNPNSGLKAVAIHCALCHSTVDNSFAPGIGRRLDGWANQDLNVGAIAALSPDVSAFQTLLGVDEATVRRVLNSWGPGRFDAQLAFDGKAFRPDGGNASTLIPAAYGLAGVNQHTWTGSWGTVTYWNALVANLEMHGMPGTFFDPRLDNAEKFPIAARARMGHVRAEPGADRITSKLAPLHFYQLSLPAPKPPAGSFDATAAARGAATFNNQARCATCHVPPLFTEPGWNLHTPQEIGIDSFQADRSPDGRYRTAPLAGRLFNRTRGFYHDGRFATLLDVVNHYNSHQQLGLSEPQKADLVEYLKSI